jgi:hypothetical protein
MIREHQDLTRITLAVLFIGGISASQIGCRPRAATGPIPGHSGLLRLAVPADAARQHGRMQVENRLAAFEISSRKQTSLSFSRVAAIPCMSRYALLEIQCHIRD